MTYEVAKKIVKQLDEAYREIERLKQTLYEIGLVINDETNKQQ